MSMMICESTKEVKYVNRVFVVTKQPSKIMACPRSSILSAISKLSVAVLALSVMAIFLRTNCEAQPPVVQPVEEHTSPMEESTIIYLNVESPSVEVATPQSLYDTIPKEDVKLVERVVQHEVGNLSEKYKQLVTEVIYNRLVSDEFPSTLPEVLYQENQFQGIEYWGIHGDPADEDTVRIVKEVFSSESPSHNATYYYNPALSDFKSVLWFEESGDVEYQFQHEETSWGVTYTTRFFR